MSAVSREGPRLRADFRGRGRRAADLPQDHRLFAGQGKKLTTPFGPPAMAVRHLASPFRGRLRGGDPAARPRRSLERDPNRSVDAAEPLRGASERRRRDAYVSRFGSRRLGRFCHAANRSADVCRAFYLPHGCRSTKIRPVPVAHRRRRRRSRPSRGEARSRPSVLPRLARRETPLRSRPSVFSTSCRRHCPRSRNASRRPAADGRAFRAEMPASRRGSVIPFSPSSDLCRITIRMRGLRRDRIGLANAARVSAVGFSLIAHGLMASLVLLRRDDSCPILSKYTSIHDYQ